MVVLLVVMGSISIFQLRTRMSGARLGSDVTYILDDQGNARVEMVEKTYFVDADTERNFDGVVARVGQPDIDRFGKGVEESIRNLAEKTGRMGMVVSGFEARFDKKADYGARVYRFRWDGFAERRDGMWVVDFRAADDAKLTRDSSLAIVLPPGAMLVKVNPSPSSNDGGKLVWTGIGEMAWPYIEYRLE